MKSSQDRIRTMRVRKRKRIWEFEECDNFILEVTPPRSIVKLRKLKKLSPKFCNHFDIVKGIEPIVYELKLPDDWKIQNAFHVSLSKKYVSDRNHALPKLPKEAP